MTSKNIKDWGAPENANQISKYTPSMQWIHTSNPHSRLKALSAFKIWYFQQHKNGR